MEKQTRREGPSDEDALDNGLELTFPASDPVSITQPRRRPSSRRDRIPRHEPEETHRNEPMPRDD
jgi:hypothetical protein